jgi:predicted secreted hydrolase
MGCDTGIAAPGRQDMVYRVATIVLAVLLLSSLAFMTACCSSGPEEEYPYGTPQFEFPTDEGAHPDSAVEWWYLNALLEDAQGREYTAMAAYFTPPLKIVSISDLEAETFHQYHSMFPLISSYMPDYAVGELDLRWHDSDHWYRTEPEALSYRIEANGTDVGFSLDLHSEKPPLPVGGDGLVEWSDESSYYYSLTRLQAEGQIWMAGETIDVEGIGWMDHQWMDGLRQGGWDWFSVQLDSDTEIIFWRIVNPDESVESLDMTLMFSDGSIYHTKDISLESLETWVSPDTGEEYGIRWRLREDGQDLDLELEARYPEQEIRLFESTPQIAWQFWEGGMRVSGEMGGEEVSGNGYAELVRFPSIGE